MKSESTAVHPVILRAKLFFALSRTTHGVLDLATPALSALLWLGRFPSASVTALGLLAAFAGYTSVYALNDLVDYRTDRERIRRDVMRDAPEYLDTVFVRHPVARGLLSFRHGLAWAFFWAIIALFCAYLLNPVCALLFLAGVLLEAVYCVMLQVSHLRVLVSGVVKTLGGLAAVFAVDPSPSPLFLTLLFAWLFLWEIGGQNVPADWHDIEEDSLLSYRTVPVRFGTSGAIWIILAALFGAILCNLLLLASTAGPFPVFLAAGCLLAGIYFLVVPAFHLYRARTTAAVSALFGRASLYPGAVLAMVLLKTLLAL